MSYEAEYEDDGGEPALVPPHDLDAEASVLSGVMLDPKRIVSVDFLRPDHFFSEAHRQVWTAIRELADEGQEIDITLVAARLKEKKRLAQVGGVQYLMQILDSCAVIRNLRPYAMTVYERWRLRQTIQVAQRFAARGYSDAVTDVQSFVDEATKELASIGRQNPASNTETNAQLCRRLVEQMASTANLSAEDAAERSAGLMTGISCVDQQTLGIRPTEKVTIMAERGRGKSTIALQTAMRVAGFRGLDRDLARERGAVLFFSTEMGRDEIGDKQLAFASRIDSRRIGLARVKPTLDEREWGRLYQALNLVEQLKITIDDRPGLTVDHVVAATKQAVERSVAVDGVPLALVVVDYVQRLAVPPHLGKKRQDEQIGYATTALKDLARETGVAVLELSAMNTPDPKVSPDGKPYEGLASYCRLIERESNRVWCIWRPQRSEKKRVRLTSTKERAGEEFDLELGFEPEFGRFFDPAWEGFTDSFFDGDT